MNNNLVQFKTLIKILNIHSEFEYQPALHLADCIKQYLIKCLNFNEINTHKDIQKLQKGNMTIIIKENNGSPTWYIYKKNNIKIKLNINSEMIEYIFKQHEYLENI